MRRVVITGMGIVSPVGVGVDYVWKSLLDGKSGIRTTKGFDTSEIASKVSGEVPLGDYAQGGWNIDEWMDSKEARRNDKFIAYAVSAAKQAMKDSGLLDILSDEDKLNFGVNIGSGIGGLQSIYENSVLLSSGGYKKISPFFLPASLINLASGFVSIEYGLKGPNTSVVTACATGTHAIGDSYRMIKYGDADYMIAGGSDTSVVPIGVAGFARMNALSTNFNDTPSKASRPWSADRDGFVIAEGAGIVVLEEYERAKRRGAKIYAEVVGYGMSGDAGHITAPAPDGNGAGRCMEKALQSANLSGDKIGYINAHGTSTPLGDLAEMFAIKRVFGDQAYKIPVSSTKSATGHMLGAAGAVEAIFSAKALETSMLPPTLNLEQPDEKADLDFVPLVAREKKIEYAMSNSFGFGGTNGTLIFKKV